jgi:hypothetical protein
MEILFNNNFFGKLSKSIFCHVWRRKKLRGEVLISKDITNLLFWKILETKG